MRMLSVMACLVLFSGCSVQSSQLSAVMDLFKTPARDISLNSWSVKYADYEAIVYPITIPQGTLFSNKAGDQVLFDGWSIREVKGMGRRQVNYKNSDGKDGRSFLRGVRPLTIHPCQPWQKRKKLGKTQFSQKCGEQEGYINTILVENDGSISVIRQIVDDRYIPMTLTKLK